MGLEKSRQVRKTINCLDIDGIKIYDNDKILAEEVNLYKTLYSSSQTDVIDIQNYIENTIIDHKLVENDSNLCEGNLTTEELKNPP